MSARRHRFFPRRGLDGVLITGESECRCGMQRRPSIFKDWYYVQPDGSSFSTYRGQSLGDCPGRRVPPESVETNKKESA